MGLCPRRPPLWPGPPAVLFHYSRDRRGEHPQRHLASYAGILQADAYSGFGRLYEPTRAGGPITEALCWAHARRNFFELADLSQARRESPASPLALEAVRRIDAVFANEREINGHPADERLAYRRQYTAPLVSDLLGWMSNERPKLSRHAEVAKAIDYMLSAGRPSPGSSMTDGSASATTLPNERCAVWPSAGKPGCSVAPIAAVSALPPSTP